MNEKIILEKIQQLKRKQKILFLLSGTSVVGYILCYVAILHFELLPPLDSKLRYNYGVNHVCYLINREIGGEKMGKNILKGMGELRTGLKDKSKIEWR